MAPQLFDNDGVYLGPHKPGITFRNCPHSEQHGGWGCNACAIEALQWRKRHRTPPEELLPLWDDGIFEEEA